MTIWKTFAIDTNAAFGLVDSAEKWQAIVHSTAELPNFHADIIRGATGGEDPEAEDFWLTLEAASRAIPALKAVFGTDDLDYLWRPHCLNYFESLDSTVKHLWTSGVRA
jgi:hypothetical protein